MPKLLRHDGSWLETRTPTIWETPALLLQQLATSSCSILFASHEEKKESVVFAALLIQAKPALHFRNAGFAQKGQERGVNGVRIKSRRPIIAPSLSTWTHKDTSSRGDGEESPQIDILLSTLDGWWKSHSLTTRDLPDQITLTLVRTTMCLEVGVM